MQQPVLQTTRLVLRPYKMSDAERVHELVGNFEVAKTTQNIPHPYTLDMAYEWISAHSEALKQGDRMVYAVTLQEIDDLIGTVSLLNISNKEASLGYWIGEPYWGNGYCTEAVAAILEFSFDILKLNRVYAEHLAVNPASGRVMKKNEMVHIGNREVTDRFSENVPVEIYERFNI